MDASLTLSFLIIQGVGIIAYSIYASSFQFLKPRQTILTQAFSNFLLAGHFFGLGSAMATYIALIASARDLGNGLGRGARIRKIVAVLFAVLLGLGALFFYREWFDACAVAGAAMMAFAQMFKDRFYPYRILCFGHQVMWLIVFFMIASVPGLVFMSCIVTSNIIGIWRYRQTGRTA
jgi:uncharacterized membrane protein (UPF0136 family)